MAETINDLYLKYANKIGTTLESDRYFQYLFEMVQAGENVLQQKYQVMHKVVDEAWISTIEDSLDAINTIIEKPRRFIDTKEEVVPVALARKITADSVRHLSMNTQFIASSEDGDIQPTRVLNVSTEESYNLYENRFIYHLIQRLVTFIDKRTDVIFWSTGDETQNTISFQSKIDDAYEKIDYKIEMTVKNLQSFAENDTDNMALFMRIDRVRRMVMALKHSSFCDIMAGCSKVRSPIQRTNLIMKDPYYRTCYKLWQFLENYDDVGYSIEVQDTPLEFDEEYLFQMYTNLITNYTVFKSLTEADTRNIDEAVGTKRKKIKPKFIKKIKEVIVDDYNIEDVEIRKVIIEEVTKAQLEAEAKLEEETKARQKAEQTLEEMDSQMIALQQQISNLMMMNQEAEIRAEEERTAKEAALEEAETAKAECQTAKEEAEAAKAEAEMAKEEMETVKREVDELVEKTKREAAETVERANAEAQARIETIQKEANDEIETTKRESTELIEKTKHEADEMVATAQRESAELVEKTKREAAETVERANAEAQARIETIRKEANDEIEVTKRESAELVDKTKHEADEMVATAQRESAELVDKTKREAAETVERTNAEAQARIETIQKEANDEIEATKRESAELVDKTKREADEMIETTKRESADLVEKTKHEADEMVATAQHEADEKVEDTKREAAEVVERTNAEAQAQINAIKKKATEAVERANTEAQKQIDTIKKETRDALETAQQDAKEARENVEDLKHRAGSEIAELRKKNEQLKAERDDFAKRKDLLEQRSEELTAKMERDALAFKKQESTLEREKHDLMQRLRESNSTVDELEKKLDASENETKDALEKARLATQKAQARTLSHYLIDKWDSRKNKK